MHESPEVIVSPRQGEATLICSMHVSVEEADSSSGHNIPYTPQDGDGRYEDVRLCQYVTIKVKKGKSEKANEVRDLGR